MLKNGRTTQDAAREIAIYEAALARVLDSLQRYRDSLMAANRRVRDSVHAARVQAERACDLPVSGQLNIAKTLSTGNVDQLDGPIANTYPDSGSWMGDDRTGAYYRTTCEAAKRIPVDHRIYFGAEKPRPECTPLALQATRLLTLMNWKIFTSCWSASTSLTS